MRTVAFRRLQLFLSVIFLMVFTGLATAQVSVKLGPATGAEFDYFGESVAINGDYAIVGSWLNDNQNGKDAGAARIYHRSGAQWVEQAVLLADDGEAGDQFGISVAINGDVAFVGAHKDDNVNGPFAGAVYVFRRNGTNWTQLTKLVAHDGLFDDQFGISVATRGARLIIGASGVNNNQGAAYIYHQTNGDWLFVSRVEASDGLQGDGFGRSVDIDAESAIVGSATRDEGGLTDAGAAYIFTFNGSSWVEQTKLLSSEATSEGSFGHAVSISSNYVLVGAPNETVDGADKAGAAYVFIRNGTEWSEQTRLLGFEVAGGDEFGFAVSLLGEYAVVGARWHRNNQGAKAGAAYLYRRAGVAWSSEARLQAADGDVGDQFGNAVGFSNEQVIIGARWDDTGFGKDAGSAYIFPVGGAGVPSLLSSIESLDFGAESVGEETERSFSVANNGTADLNLSSIRLEGGGASHFRIVQGGGGALLAPLANIDVIVEFVPQSPGDKTAFLRIESNDPASPFLMSLTGTATDGLQPGVAKVLASRGNVESFFGSTVAVAGDYAIVGAEGQSATESGAAYIYKRDGENWVQQERISALDGVPGDRFGSAVDISATHAIVGAWNDDEAQGAAYIFVRSGSAWIQQSKLVASDGLAGAYFGQSVAIEGGTAVVGAWQDTNERGEAAGAAYVFLQNGGSWQQNAKLIPSDLQQGDRFGSAVSVSGSTVLVGAANGGFFGEGTAYVFSSNGTIWNLDATLVSPGAGLSDGFGSTVAIEGDVAIIGAPLQDNDATIDEGAAYGFIKENGVWGDGVKLTASDGSSGFEFGSAVDIIDNELVVGARGANNQRGSVYIFLRAGNSWDETLTLEAASGTDGDAFGSALAFTGFDLIVGAPENSNVNGTSAGAVYLYNRSGNEWNEQARLIASNSLIQPRFGSAVSISGDTAVIGAEGTESDPGAAYVYQRNGVNWSQVAELAASDGAAGDRFGASVAIDGDYIVVGAPADDNERGEGAGTVYVFLRGSESWSEQSRLIAQDGSIDDYFGASVTISGDMVAVGAPDDDNTRGEDAGSIYIFERNGAQWSETDRLSASDGVAGDQFGKSVGLQNTTLVGGAPNEGLLKAGAVYVFEQFGSTWNEEAKLIASDAASGDALGSAVDIDDIYIAAGATERNNGAGTVYIYRRTSGVWGPTEITSLRGETSEPGDAFGASVSLSGAFALVGSEGADDGRGASYLYQRDGEDWLQQTRLTPQDEGGSDQFGHAVALEGEYAVIGAFSDDNGNGSQAGSAYILALEGAVIIVSTEEPVLSERQFSLEQNYPNPFIDRTTIPYVIESPGHVRIEVYDVLGRQVTTLVDEQLVAGRYEAIFDAHRLSSGLYFYRMIAGDHTETRRFIVIE